MDTTNIQQISSDQLDQLFAGVPTTTPTADNLLVGQQQLDDNPVEDIDLDTLDEITPSTQAITTTNEPAVEESADVVTETPVVEQDALSEESRADIHNTLKNTVDYLVDKGFWMDFENRDSLEYTDDVYANIASRQAQESAYAIVDELINSTGSYGKAIIDHIKAGGDPDDIIDIFKEQRELSQLDTRTEDGKQSKIEKYYSDILGWRKDRIQKHITRLIEDNEIDDEFAEIETLYDNHYKRELDKIKMEAEEEEQKKMKVQKAFVDSIRNSLTANNNFTESEKKAIASSILDFRHTLNNGQKVNDFYVRFAEKQADPNEYIDLVHFVMDKEGYIKRLTRSLQTEANNKAFSFIKGNNTINKAQTQEIQIAKQNNSRTERQGGTDFSFINKK